jgi:hypothetical protein
MDELQLHDLKNIEADSDWLSCQPGDRRNSLPAVDVKQKARPAKHDVAIVPRPPARGKLSRRPIVVAGKMRSSSGCETVGASNLHNCNKLKIR